MPPARQGRTAVTHGGNPQDRAASPKSKIQNLKLNNSVITHQMTADLSDKCSKSPLG